MDASGAAYIVGDTFSTNFPTANALQPAHAGLIFNSDLFLTKLNPAGSALVYSTYLGGSAQDSSFGIAVDPGGNAYVTGFTQSTDFPAVNALQPTFQGGLDDGFVAKLNAAGSPPLVYSTYLGGTGDDLGAAITADAAGNAYVGGRTTSADFPTASALQPAPGGAEDGFIAKLDPAGSALIYSTYLGGSAFDAVTGIAVDSTGHVFVAGETFSTDFPTANPLQPALAGSDDAFVAKLDPAGSALVYSTYLGGTGGDFAGSIAVDSGGNAYVAGGTASTDFPTVNAVQSAFGGAADAFVAKISPFGPFFPGQGQRPPDVNAFLVYASPLQARADLPAGTTSFTVHIFYGPTIDAATFQATLNGVPFGGFTPGAGANEMVSIPLSSGRSVLVLEVEGTRIDGRTATDRDRLTFVVP